jgi:hypothetical protein
MTSSTLEHPRVVSESSLFWPFGSRVPAQLVGLKR